VGLVFGLLFVVLASAFNIAIFSVIFTVEVLTIIFFVALRLVLSLLFGLLRARLIGHSPVAGSGGP